MTQINQLMGVGVRLSLLAVALFYGMASCANAAFIEEYFNGYGTTDGNLAGKGAGGGGWSAGWGGHSASNYQAGSQLTYGGTGYDNAGNNATSNDGRADYGSGNTANIATRAFTTAMDGTIWMSWLSDNQGNAEFAAQLSFEGTTSNYFRLVDGGVSGVVGNRQGAYNNVTMNPTLGQVSGYTPGTTALMLTKIDMNYSGALDRVTVWLNPDLSSGMASIGSGHVLGDSADVFGATLSSIGVSFSRSFGTIDAIRISNEATGFFDVTGFVEPVVEAAPIPEPASLVLLVFGIPAIVRRRNRAARGDRRCVNFLVQQKKGRQVCNSTICQ